MKQKKRQKNQRYAEFLRKTLEPQETKRLLALQKSLRKLGTFPETDSKKIILFHINFLDIVSSFQDDGYLKYQPQKKRKIAELFNFAIQRSGRQNASPKWNVTKKGEKVTKRNVVYGGVFGLPIKPAIYWLSLPKNKTVTLDYHHLLEVDKKNSPIIKTEKVWQTDAIVNAGIRQFTENNLKVILNCIDRLLA